MEHSDHWITPTPPSYVKGSNHAGLHTQSRFRNALSGQNTYIHIVVVNDDISTRLSQFRNALSGLDPNIHIVVVNDGISNISTRFQATSMGSITADHVQVRILP